jgi:glycosyltransferase involved in cell wall biosynthesis
MKIAMTSYYLPPQDRIGAGYMQHYLANAYVRAGHCVTMFSPVRVKSEDALYDLVTVPVGESNRFFRFARNLRKQDLRTFDVLHTGSESFLLGGKRRPYHICTYHGACLAEAIHAKSIKDRVRMVIFAMAEIVQCLVADRNVCVSRDTRRYIPLAKEVIWNGVDRTQFRPGPPKSAAPSILFVGELDSRKRGRELVEIFRTVIRPAVPNAELWIARDGTPVEVEGVHVFGRVSLEKLIELYQTAWIFCLPSSYEGFGVPYIEAMSSGTPVVATPNAGAKEVLENGKYGRIADLPQLGATLLEILQSDTERERLTNLGLSRAEDFDWQRIVELYLSTVPKSLPN